jgi:hypothetical protein
MSWRTHHSASQFDLSENIIFYLFNEIIKKNLYLSTIFSLFCSCRFFVERVKCDRIEFGNFAFQIVTATILDCILTKFSKKLPMPITLKMSPMQIGQREHNSTGQTSQFVIHRYGCHFCPPDFFL